MKSAPKYFPKTLSRLWLLMALAITGCTVGPNYRKPSIALPESYSEATQTGVTMAQKSGSPTTPSPAVIDAWWTVFGDARLAALIQTASRSNLDIRIAESRIREVRAQRGLTRSTVFPSIDAQAGYNRSSLSKNSINGQQLAALGQPLENDFFDANLDMRWELDFFGGRRRAIERATAEVQSSVEMGRQILVTIQAEVGLTYLELRGIQRQLTVARENLRSQQQTLALSSDRFQAGVASELDASRAAAQVATTLATIPPLREAERRAIHRLGVLLGKSPQELLPILSVEVPPPDTPPRVPVGLPSDLLRQRPDIRRAERDLAAATAQIGVATSELFPKFYLTAAAGLQSLDAGDLVDAGSRFWSLGPTLHWPIFNAGRIRQNIQVQNSKQEQALLNYEQTVLASLEDVENALVAFGQEQDRFRALKESVDATRRSVSLANERYRGGLANFLDVLESERIHLSAQDALAQSEQRLGQNLIRLFKALGGGWAWETAG